MRNYVQAEFYKSLHRMYFWMITLGCILLALSGLLLCNYLGSKGFGNVSLENFIAMGVNMFGSAIFIIIMFADMVTAEEYQHHTIKNIVSSGLTRRKIYLTKNLVSGLLMTLSFIIIAIASVLLGIIFLKSDGALSMGVVLKDFIVRLAAVMFIWWGGMAVANFIAVSVRNSTVFAVTYAAVMILVSKVISILAYYVNDKIGLLKPFLLTTQIGVIKSEHITGQQLWTSIGVGILYIVVFNLAGMFIFKRSDV